MGKTLKRVHLPTIVVVVILILVGLMLYHKLVNKG